MGEVRVGLSPDFNKSTLTRMKESVERHLTISGSKKEWYEKHKGRIENFKRVEAQLSYEQRKQVLDKMDRDATLSAVWKVGRNALGLATTLGAVVLGGRIAFDAQYRGSVLHEIQHFDYKTAFRQASERAGSIFTTMKDKAKQTVERGRDALRNIGGGAA